MSPRLPKLMYWSITIALCFSLVLTFELPARAYTDPGSALLLFQSLGALASGVLFYFRRSLKRLITRKETSKPVSRPAIMSRVDS